MNFRNSNKNSLERRAGSYRSSRKKSPYTKHTWSSSLMKQQEQPFILVVLPTSDFRSFCKYNMELSCYHIFSTSTLAQLKNKLGYLQTNNTRQSKSINKNSRTRRYKTRNQQPTQFTPACCQRSYPKEQQITYPTKLRD